MQAKSFIEGDYVLRKVFQNTQEPNAWTKMEGPYQINKIIGNGAYQLMQHDVTMIPRSLNVVHLKNIIFS